jgi:hypothetical protein
MNPLVAALRGCFHQAAGVCRCPVGRLLGGYGLNDFLTNSAQDQDDAPTLAVKALTYFCEGARPADTQIPGGRLGGCRLPELPPRQPAPARDTAASGA